jgi:hypothetical protein
MGKIHKRNCNECNTYYEGRGIYFCSIKCSSINKDRRLKSSKSHKGQIAWNKGISMLINNSLSLWRSKGGLPWNKGLKGIHLSPNTEFKKGDKRINGSNNPNWKGGVSDTNKKIRKSKEYLYWVDSVYRRDKFICQECNIKCQKGNIIAHHIKPFSRFPKIRFDIDNGVTLCRSCHARIHNPKNKFSINPIKEVIKYDM